MEMSGDQAEPRGRLTRKICVTAAATCALAAAAAVASQDVGRVSSVLAQYTYAAPPQYNHQVSWRESERRVLGGSGLGVGSGPRAAPSQHPAQPQLRTPGPQGCRV